jgi:hypothetical protein
MPLALTQLQSALKAFATTSVTQGQEHIKPFHGYVATRLVVEGGFLPEEITPHPPLKATRTAGQWVLAYDPEAATSEELTVFGGMKTKQIDVVVAKKSIGPVMAVSVKGTIKAYRNLVNRMEEAIGDSTNLHVMYPGLVYGFLHLLRANREESGYGPKDMGLARDGAVSAMITRYFSALCEMTGRRFVRNDFTRYEAVALALVENEGPSVGSVHAGFPSADSLLRIELFFPRLYEVYDLRFPFRGETVRGALRKTWSAGSPLFQEAGADVEKSWELRLGYRPRLAE